MEYIAVLIGSLIYLLFQLNGVLNMPEFKWGKFIRTNIVPAVLNIVIGFALVFAKDIQDFYPITFVSAMVLGVAGQAIFKKSINTVDLEQNTFVGFNK